MDQPVLVVSLSWMMMLHQQMMIPHQVSEKQNPVSGMLEIRHFASLIVLLNGQNWICTG